MNEKELDQLLEIDEKTDLTFNKSLRKKINKKIYIRSIITVIVACLIVISGYYGISYIMSWENYNPYHETGIVGSDDAAIEEDFELLMQTYIEMIFSGKRYISTNSAEKPSITSLGFGNYKLVAKIESRFAPTKFDGQSNTIFTISHSQLTNVETTQVDTLSLVVDEFKDPKNKHFQAVTTLKDIKDELNNLPDSTVLDVSISFKDYKSLDDIIEFKKRYPNTTMNWLALKDQETSRVQGISGGMSLFDNVYYSLTDEASKKYPHFYLEDQLTAEKLKQNYLSRLQLLIDHPDFINMLSSYSGSEISQDMLQEKYNKAKKEMKGYGLRLYTNKQDLLAMLEGDNISYVYINDLKLSQYQK